MKFLKNYSLIIAIFVLLIIFSLAGMIWFKAMSGSVSNDETEIAFVIPKGSSAVKTASLLKEKGLIKSELAFKIHVQLYGLSEKIQAGEYMLSSSMDLAELVKELTTGPLAIWVTIPEGYRREQIAQRFIESFGLTEADAQMFFVEFMQESEGSEGRLFPDTYLIEKHTSAQKIVDLLVNTFNTKTKEMEVSNNDLILASLIEREAITDEEKPTVAGVLYNRLQNDWPLQVDATLQYIVANNRCEGEELTCDWWRVPTANDKNINSPYNTYQSVGLPLAPIANPGITAIQAAVEPADTEYYFYIHDASGQIHFARTLEEHNANIAKHLR